MRSRLMKGNNNKYMAVVCKVKVEGHLKRLQVTGHRQ